MKTKLKVIVTFGPASHFTVPVVTQTNGEVEGEMEFRNQIQDLARNRAAANQIRSFANDLPRQNINSLRLQRLLACRAKQSVGFSIRGRRYSAGKSPPGSY